MAKITRSEIIKVVRDFLDEYGCGSYLEGALPANGPKFPDNLKPDLFFVQKDDEGNSNDGVVMIIEEGKQHQKALQDNLRSVVDAWVNDEFDLLMISLPATDGEKNVEELENNGIYADYWMLYEKEDSGEMSLTILYDEMDEEDEPIIEEEIILEETKMVPSEGKTTKKAAPAKKTTTTKAKPKKPKK